MKNLFNIWPLVLCASLVTGCSTVPRMPEVDNPPHADIMHPVSHTERPVIGIALGSGAARGFAHVGVLKALQENGIEADIIVGTSSGSVVGALYAGDIRGDALVDAASQLDRDKLTDWMFPNRGVVKGELLQQYVNDFLNNRPIEALKIKFAAIVTNLESGELVVLNAGDTGMAVRASSAVPGIIQPVMIKGYEYVDGGLVSQVPVQVTRAYGADLVIAVDVSRTLLSHEKLGSTLSLMQQSLIIMSDTIAKVELTEADIVIRPEVGEIGLGEFKQRDVAVRAGEVAGLAAIPEIKRRLAELQAQIKQMIQHQGFR